MAVGSGDDSNIRGNDAGTSHAFKLALLEHSEQCNLSFRGKFADFIKKNRTGMRQFKAALVPLQSAGESPLLVAKQFRADKRRRNPGPIPADKPLPPPPRTL